MADKYSGIIQELIEKRRIGRVVRGCCPNYFLEGYFLGASDEWIQMGVVNDFVYDGVVFIRAQDILSIRKKQEAFYHRVLCKEGVHSNAYSQSIAPLQSSRELLAWSKKQVAFTLLDFDYDEKPSLHIGRILALYKKSLHFIGFDTGGRWWKESRKIDIADISSIRIGSHYAEIYRKYMNILPC